MSLFCHSPLCPQFLFLVLHLIVRSLSSSCFLPHLCSSTCLSFPHPLLRAHAETCRSTCTDQSADPNWYILNRLLVAETIWSNLSYQIKAIHYFLYLWKSTLMSMSWHFTSLWVCKPHFEGDVLLSALLIYIKLYSYVPLYTSEWHGKK